MKFEVCDLRFGSVSRMQIYLQPNAQFQLYNRDQAIWLLNSPSKASPDLHLANLQPIFLTQSSCHLRSHNIYQTRHSHADCLRLSQDQARVRILDVADNLPSNDLGILTWWFTVCLVSSVYSNYNSNFINFVSKLASVRHNRGVVLLVWSLASSRGWIGS